MRRGLLIVVAVVLAAGAGIYVLSGAGGPGAGASPSPTLAPVPAANTVTADAQVVPARGAELSAPGAGGRVVDVPVREGDQVQADAPLLKLDDRAALAELASAQAALASAQAASAQADATIRQADAGIDAAEAGVTQAAAGVTIADANRDGLPSGASDDQERAADAQVSQATGALRAARAELSRARQARNIAVEAANGAKAEVTRAQAGVDAAEIALDELTLKAPFAGTVAFVGPEVGETVGAGTPVVRLADPSGWRIETTDLDEASVARITDGATATVTVDAFPEDPIDAKVVEIASFGESQAGDIVFRVILEPTGTDLPALRWNMTASVSIDAAS
jgi:HlyD family secretion protein